MRFRYDLQTGAVTMDGTRLDDHGLLVCYQDGDLLVHARQVISIAMFTARLTDCDSRPDCSCSSMVVYLQHVPQVLHEVMTSTSACMAASTKHVC